MEETANYEQIQFVHIDAVMCVIGNHPDSIFSDGNMCDCEFFTSVGLPCRHIIAFRHQNNLNLFVPTIVADRWLKENMLMMTETDYITDATPNVEIILTPNESRRRQQKKTTNQKYNKSQELCREICGLMSELPEREFDRHFELLDEFLDRLKETVNHEDATSNTQTLLQSVSALMNNTADSTDCTSSNQSTNTQIIMYRMCHFRWTHFVSK